MWDLIVSVPDHCLSFYFPLFSYIILANSEGAGETGETAWMCRFLRAFPFRLSDNNPFLMCRA